MSDIDPNKIIDIVVKSAGSITKPLAAYLDKKLSPWQIENLCDIMDMFHKKCSERGLNKSQQHALARKSGHEWIMEASKEEVPDMKEMWANLLYQSVEKSSNIPTLTYIRILKDLTAEDKEVLLRIREFEHFHVKLTKGNDYYTLLKDNSLMEILSEEQLIASISTICHLNLISPGKGDSGDCYERSPLLELFLKSVI